MRQFLFTVFCLFMLACSGCALVDFLLGTNQKGESKPNIVSTIVTGALNGLFPGSGAAITAVGGLYAAWRGRKWKAAAKSTWDAVEEHGDKALKERISAKHRDAGVQKLAQKEVKKYKKPAPPPSEPPPPAVLNTA